MGFYGNITNTSKTTFSFDKTYPTRQSMEQAAESDGVFLGRYVLIDYDGEAIKAYLLKDDKGIQHFYHTNTPNEKTKITPQLGVVYQNIATVGSVEFYIWNNGEYIRFTNAANNYAACFNVDVRAYGRGYDSTVWVKQYDVNSNRYKYALIAELNAVIPNLHLIVDPPNSTPMAPYFDRDTDNLNYYIHMQSDYGTRVQKAGLIENQNNWKDTPWNNNGEMRSDEQVTRMIGELTQDASGYPIWKEKEESVEADIFYNKAGFNVNHHNFVNHSGEYSVKADNGDQTFDYTFDYGQDTIGYNINQSGKKYNNTGGEDIYQTGITAPDIYDWYIRLPSIGNSICQMWDKIYGYKDQKDKPRYINDAQHRKDNTSDNLLINYDKTTLIGVMNTYKDLLGYYYIPLTSIGDQNVLDDATTTININSTYQTIEANKTGSTTVEHAYPLINSLIYDDSVSPIKYYHYCYSPKYDKYTGETLDNTKSYYQKVSNGWKPANLNMFEAVDANQNSISQQLYTRIDKWELVPLDLNTEDSLYGLIATMHKLLGTDSESHPDENSVLGCINILKGLIADIGNLAPGKLLHTNNNGIIETTETSFPAADWDKDEILSGDGTWVSRFAEIKICHNSDNANRKVSEVINFEKTTDTPGSAPVKLINEAATLISDNQRTKVFDEKTERNISQFKKDHVPNALTLATRDKWIKLHPNEEKDSLEFEHTQSPFVEQLSYEALDVPGTDVTIDGPADEVNSTVNTENFVAINNGTAVVIKPSTESDNENINLIYNSKIAGRNNNRLTIPTITIDNAGHVIAAGTKNYNIPHIYNKISTGTVINDEAATGKAGHTIDDLAGSVSVFAETLEEEIVYAPSNKWIRINATNTKGKDTVTFGHEIHTIVDTKPASTDLDSSDLEDKTFTTQVVNWDAAGHIIEHGTKTWILPNSIRNIKVTGIAADDATANPNGTDSSTISADKTSDTVNLSTSNIWVRLTASNNELSFGHLVREIGTTRPVLDLNLTGSAFTTEEYTHDEAGHIRTKAIKTIVLPYSYKTFKVQQNDSTSAIITNTDSIVAQNHIDTMRFEAGNKWIQLAAQNSDTLGNDAIIIAHSLQGTAGSYTGTDITFIPEEDTEPRFGESVTLYGYETDNAGHIISNPTYTLTLPKGSYSNDISNGLANVITGMAFDDKTGAITTTSENVGTLVLTGYTKLDATTTAAITATNTINEAFATLDNRIEAEEEARKTAIANEVSARNTAIATEIEKQWINTYTSFDDLYTAVIEKLTSEYVLTPIENPEEEPIV